jgi:hypothetical protein
VSTDHAPFMYKTDWVNSGAYQLAITIGLLLASIVGNATKKLQNTGCYRIPIAIQFAWALILFTGLVILPETPRFYIKKGKHEKAARALAKLRRLDIDHPSIEAELAEIPPTTSTRCPLESPATSTASRAILASVSLPVVVFKLSSN